MIAWQWFKAQDPARHTRVLVGYVAKSVRTIIHLDAAGNFRCVEVLPEKQPREVLVPNGARSSGVVAYTVDNYEYTLGAGQAGKGLAHVQARHEAYRALMASFDHPAARAITTFLRTTQRPCIVPLGTETTPEERERLSQVEPQVGAVDVTGAKRVRFDQPGLLSLWAQTLHTATTHARGDRHYTNDVPQGVVLFEIEGHPEWWLDDVFVEAKRAERAADQGDAIGRCSLCYQRKPLARKFDVTSLAKGPLLVSFNVDSFCAFGRSQSLTAPTCQDCAESLVRGFNAIVETPGVTKHNPGKTYHAVLWWEATLRVSLWEAFSIALDADRPVEERRAALRSIPEESYFLILKRNEKRLTIRRHAYVRRADLIARLERAIAHNLHFNDTVKALTLGAVGEVEEKAASAEWREHLLIDLIGGEPLAPREIQRVTSRWYASRAPGFRSGQYLNRHTTNLLAYLGEDHMKTHEPTTDEQRSCIALGEAIARLDYLQYKQNPRVQKPHSTILLKQAVSDPQSVRAGLLERAQMGIHGKVVHDAQVSKLFLACGYLPIGRRLTALEANFVLEGFVNSREAMFAAARARDAMSGVDANPTA